MEWGTVRQNPLRRVMRTTLEWLERLKAVDLLLFWIVIMLKILWFDQLLDIPNMRMDDYDKYVAAGTLGIVSFWTIWLPTRGRIVALAIVNVLLSFLMYADIIYYRYFQDLISVPVLMQASQVDSLGESIGTLLEAADFWLLADWIIVIPFAVYTIWRGGADLRDTFGADRRKAGWRQWAVRVALGVAIGVMGTNMAIGHISEARRTWAIGLFENNWWSLSLYNVTGVVGFHGYDVYRYAKQHWLGTEQVSAEAADEIRQWTEERADGRHHLEQASSFGAYKGSNVLLVQVEALQNFMIDRSIGGEEITPNLNRLVKESAYFDQFYHQTSQGRTSDADFLANCSLQPLASGSVFIQYASHTFNCLPQTLSDNGYETTVHHAYDGGFWNRNTMYPSMGYDHFYSKKHFELDEPIGWSLGDRSFFRQSMDRIDGQQQPFYAFMITLSTHHPFTMPESERKLAVGELEGTMMGDYLQSVHYADAALGELVESLKQKGLWDKTIFALYGDHDNSIKDWELFERFLEQPLNDLERQMILKQVPFIVHLPDGAYAGTQTQVGGQLDVTPTLLHLLGISTADQTLLGTPLLTANKSGNDGKLIVQRNGAFTDGKLYFLPSSDGIAANGACWSVSDNEIIDTAKCLPYVEAAAEELAKSDQIVNNDLIPQFIESRSIPASTFE
ncbi:LTA synthase family protein [Paenibacillus sp. NPDC058071]|uniref:LTA synthase family protein n=1 Tax=Paenibacillus sp. NPDC058071 TaxID=3346326 RepID=UPI0036D91526